MSRAATANPDLERPSAGGCIDGIQTRATTDDGEEYEDNLYEYDAERRLFKRYQPLLEPLTPTKPRHQKIEPEPETPPRRRFFVRLPDGTYAITRGDEYSPDDIYEYDAKKNQFVRVGK
jgi:hypothetical protein